MILQRLKNLFFWNNSLYHYLQVLIVFIVLLILLKIFREIILARLKRIAEKTKTDFDDVLIEIFKTIKPPFYLLFALYISIKTLVIPDIAFKVINIVFVVAVVYEIIHALEMIIDYLFKAKGKENSSVTKTIKLIIKISIWSFGLVLALGNLGVDISSLIAGLGIGGIAVALALQNILKDVFSSFSILIDKPFEVGDFIIVGKDMGTVEQIGIKTTKLRALDGQQLIIANSELTDARVQNFKRLEKRRALFTLGVTYETKKELLEKIPSFIKEIIENQEQAEFDRCHFKSFKDSSLDFETSYYVNTQDYKEYLDVVEKINLSIIDKFRKENISFAYPTHVEYQKTI